MVNCAYCGAELPGGKYRFKMEIHEGDKKKVALFCQKCGARMSAELKKKQMEVKKAKVAEKGNV